jgi:hypothetical protein
MSVPFILYVVLGLAGLGGLTLMVSEGHVPLAIGVTAAVAVGMYALRRRSYRVDLLLGVAYLAVVVYYLVRDRL